MIVVAPIFSKRRRLNYWRKPRPQLRHRLFGPTPILQTSSFELLKKASSPTSSSPLWSYTYSPTPLESPMIYLLITRLQRSRIVITYPIWFWWRCDAIGEDSKEESRNEIKKRKQRKKNEWESEEGIKEKSSISMIMVITSIFDT